MRKTVLAAVLSTMIAGVASPALAHDNDRYPGNNRAEASYLTSGRNADIRRDIYQLDRKIDRAVSHRAISHREGVGLHRQALKTKQLYNRYANRGLSASEYRTLEHHVSLITSRLRAEKWDRDGRRG
jgi:hypothetical protein